MVDSFVSLACSILIHNNKLSLGTGAPDESNQSGRAFLFPLFFIFLFFFLDEVRISLKEDVNIVQFKNSKIGFITMLKENIPDYVQITSPIQIWTRKKIIMRVTQ